MGPRVRSLRLLRLLLLLRSGFLGAHVEVRRLLRLRLGVTLHRRC